jgi:ribosomal protein S18 acetylase RimI-like enzyme
MDMMFWLVQGLGILTIILTLLSFLQKEKWKMNLCLGATNVCLIATYILSGSLLGGLLVLGALIRTIVFFLYSKKNKRPEPIIMIMFEVYYIVMAIVMWRNVYDLLMVINLVVVTYTSWQDDVRVLRFGYAFSSLLLIPYDILLGAYTTALSEVLMLGSVVFALIKYSKVTKTSNNVAQRYFLANKNFWGSVVETKEDYDVITSTSDNSPFYNFCILKNHNKILETIVESKKELKEKKVKEVLYVPFDAQNYNFRVSDAHMLQMFFPIVFNDVWMKLIDGFNLNNTKCKIQDVEYKEVDESHVDEIIDVYLRGYHAKTSVDDLTENEKKQVENLKNINLTDTIDGFKVSAYIAYYNGNPVSLMVMLSNNVESFITKVSTLPIFRRKHIASSLMQFGINKQRARGIQEIILCTDKYSSNEKFYSFNSFVEFGQAFALDISDISKYEGFINSNKL